MLEACTGASEVEVRPILDAHVPTTVPDVGRVVGLVISTEGETQIDRKGERRLIKEEPVFHQDILETGETGTVYLEIGGQQLELGSSGRYVIVDAVATKEVTLRVERGIVLTHVDMPDAGVRLSFPVEAKRDDQFRLTISTPFGLTRVRPADTIAMNVDADRVLVDVHVGEIELIDAKGELRRLGAGRRGVLSKLVQLPPVQLTIVLSDARALVRKKDAKQFVRLDASLASSLAAGDALRVVNGRVGVSTGGDAKVSLERGSQATLLESGRSSDLEQIAVALEQGSLSVNTPMAREFRLKLSDDLSIRTDSATQFTVRKVAHGVSVESSAGSIHVEQGDKIPVIVGGGQTAAISSDQVSVAETRRESIVLPSRNLLSLYHSGIDRATLSWDADAAVKEWRIEVSDNDAFSSPLVDGTVRSPFVTVPIPRRGSLFWRASAGTEVRARGRVDIAPEAVPEALSRVRNVVQDGPETTTIFFQDKPAVVTFSWEPVPDARSYQLRLYRQGQLGRPLVDRIVTEESLQLPDSALTEGKYLWSVVPLGASGEAQTGGRMNKLLMVYDNAVQTLVVHRPRNGDVAAARIRTSGVAPVGTKLTINEQSVTLDSQARFDVVAAPTAEGHLVYRWSNGGTQAITVRKVRRR